MANDLGFGVAFMLKDAFTNPANRIMQSLRSMEGATTTAMNKINNSINQVQTGMTVMAAGAALLAPVGLGAKYAAEFEKAEVALKTMLGSQEAAQVAFKQIQADAAATPFEIDSLLSGNIALISTGLSAKQAREDILALGNAIAGAGKGEAEMQRMIFNLQQIRNLGKANAVDIKQFGYSGINVYKLLQDSTGKSLAEVKEMDVTYDMLIKALKDASKAGGLYAGSLEAMSKTMSGKYSTLIDNVKFTLASFTNAVLFMIHPLMDGLIKLLERLREFSETPAGKVIIGIVIGLGLLLISLGAVMVAMGGVRFLAMRMALGFQALGIQSVLLAITQHGLAAGFRAAGAAMLKLLIPLIPVLIKIGLITAALYTLYRAINSGKGAVVLFVSLLAVLISPIAGVIAGILLIRRAIKDFTDFMNGTGKKQSGFLGFLQKIGGIILSVGEIIRSENGTTFTLPEKLAQALEDLGILDFVVSLGTWIARILNFFRGLWEGLKAGWKTFTQILDQVANFLKPVSNLFERLGFTLKRGASTMERWKKVGHAVGVVISGVLVVGVLALAGAMLIFAINTLIAIAPILLIAAAIAGLIYVFMNLGNIGRWVIKQITDGFNWLLKLPGRIWEGFMEMLDGFVEWGSGIVDAIIEGIDSAWGKLKNFLLGAIESLPMGKKILKFFGAGTEGGEQGGMQLATAGQTTANSKANMLTTPLNKTNALNEMAAKNKTAKQVSQSSEKFTFSEKLVSVEIPVTLDAKEIAKAVAKENNFKEKREE